MIYLNSNIFRSGLLLTSVAFLPLTIASFLLGCFEKHIFALVCSLVLFLLYLLSVLYYYRASKSTKHYLCIKGDMLVISSDSFGKESVEVPINSVVKIKYYRLLSWRAWLSTIINYVLVFGSTYIVFMKDGVQESHSIGYPKFQEIELLCKETGILLVKR